jgi:hypothetical protein
MPDLRMSVHSLPDRGRSATALTPAQRAALELLAEHEGEWLEAHKRRTGAQPGPPRVNAVAALALSRARLVDVYVRPHASVFSSPYEYRINAAGKEALANG